MGANWTYGPMTLDFRLDLQVQRVIQSTNLALTEILDRFFNGFHRWLPVVCPGLFYEILRKRDDSLPIADYSVLVLSMCLVTLQPPSEILSSSISPKDLYFMVKMMLAHVQSVICTSPSLIQASLLLAAYEYACGRPEMALISVGTCSRMAQSIGIDKRSSVQNERQCHDDLKRRALEERNIWWGIVILERIILCEMSRSDLRPTTEYPGPMAPLPSDLIHFQNSQEQIPRYETYNAPSLSEIHTKNVSTFGRRAQAVCLLDRVLSTMNSPPGGNVNFVELEKLDREILSFLEVVLDECGQEWGQHCPAVASTMRKCDKPIHRWYHWYEPGTSKEEKWLIFKLDFFILLYTCLTFFVKYLDQTNITNAYVSGMKEDLKLYGNELNWFTTYFNIGIIVGGPFSTMALTVVRPRYWLPACTIAWSFFVLFIYKAETAKTVYILRFFAGLFESGAMPGAFYIIGSWYRSSEINRRSTLFMFSSVGGQMFSGYIQAGLYRNMDHRLGLAAWRWLFIFDFIISSPVALFGFFCCPDEPKSSRMWWITEKEHQLCIQRIAEEKRNSMEATWDLPTVKRLLSCWQLYAFSISWAVMELTCGVNLQRWMTLYLKSLKVDGHYKYSTEEINDLPTIVGCAELVWMILSATLVDKYQIHAIVFFVLGSVQLFAYIVFLAWSSNDTFIIAVYYLCSAYGAIAPLISASLNSSCGGDKQMRALTTSLMISIGYAVETPAQQYMFPTSEAPRFKKSHGYDFGIVENTGSDTERGSDRTSIE
ncbi:pantothenate transporter, putative [Paecilomyces variotii No. 5]|uniref:Pantothenate transporter, putative n=1 Tax=Byssochlamys spectabilis (strain No. 5 / NBRC 109023) TaxID=1356009 RepID=V5FU87_BYSSN|nr:pantothenate transporter, putative [Paecilomyces variotii No. 5]